MVLALSAATPLTGLSRRERPDGPSSAETVPGERPMARLLPASETPSRPAKVGRTELSILNEMSRAKSAGERQPIYSFVPISEMANKTPDTEVDVIGILSYVSPMTTRYEPEVGKELAQRTVKLADDSGMSIDITIWGSLADKFPDDVGAVVAFKGARVTAWNGCSLGTNKFTSFEVAPDNEDTARLKAWHESGGGAETKSLSV